MKKDPRYPCRSCGKTLPPGLLSGAKCGECVSRDNQYAKAQKAQRLAGQMPPKGFSV